MPLNLGRDWSPGATHGFYKNLRITSLSKAPEPLQGEFTGAHLRLPSPELAPSGVELLGLGAEKGKKGEKGFFFFFLQACLGRWVFHGQFQHSPRDPAFYNKVLLGGNLKALHKPYMLIKQHIKI